MSDNDYHEKLFAGLKALAETAFPKQCAYCGRTFESVDEFLKETENIRPTVTGLKEATEEDGSKIVEVFRNCTCGSTLMEFCDDRRDLSDAGLKRRERFDELLMFLESNNIEKDLARSELIKVMKGEKSDILSNITPPE